MQTFQLPSGANATIRFLGADEVLKPLFYEHFIRHDFLDHCKPAGPKPLPREYDEHDVALMNALRKKLNPVQTPIRKKKSWLRYSSNKKWARKFKKKFEVQTEKVVLRLPSGVMTKIRALAGA